MAAAWLLPLVHNDDDLRVPAQPVAPPQPKISILVASRSLNAGTIVSEDNLEWKIASDQIPPGAVSRNEGSETANPFVGRLIIQNVEKGDVLTSSHFAQANGSSYIAQQIKPGKRAYALAIDSKGTATAGNFIQPNDYVDIIRSMNTSTGLQSDTILRDIRVLAIGQTVHGEGLSTAGDTTTVEVDIYQAEILATAQRQGQISLALRGRDADDHLIRRPDLISIIRPMAAAEKLQ